jgi:hypothetical protein
MLPHTVTIVSPTVTTGTYGEQVRTYGTTGTSAPAYLQPVVGDENTDARQLVGTKYKMWTNTALTATDRVIWESATYSVDGPARRWDAPSGGTHYEADLLLVEG